MEKIKKDYKSLVITLCNVTLFALFYLYSDYRSTVNQILIVAIVVFLIAALAILIWKVNQTIDKFISSAKKLLLKLIPYVGAVFINLWLDATIIKIFGLIGLCISVFSFCCMFVFLILDLSDDKRTSD